MRGRQLRTFVELHGDVGAEQRLDFDRALGREFDEASVEMGAKRDPRGRDLAQLRE
jgi:hypothetical protein